MRGMREKAGKKKLTEKDANINQMIPGIFV